MKLRQKLAVVLASAMVVTAVPVVTMADSTNNPKSTVKVIKKDDKTTGTVLRMKFEDADINEIEEFYFELENAEWLDGTDDVALLNGAGITVNPADEDVWTLATGGFATDTVAANIRLVRQTNKVLKVTIPAGTLQANDVVNFPLPIKATGGKVSVKVTGEGSASSITEGTYALFTTGEKAATLEIPDLNAFYDKGELSPIILKETFLKSFGADNMVLKIKLEDTDFEFLKNSDVKIEGTYGFDFKLSVRGTDANYPASPLVDFDIDADDKSVAYIYLDKALAGTAGAGNSFGRIKITGLRVDADEEDLQVGDLLADITTVKTSDDLLNGGTFTGGAELDKDYLDIAVAKIANYGAYIKMKDEKAVDIVAGREEEVVFEVIENVDDVFVGSRTIKLTLKDDQGDTNKSWFMISAAQKANPKANLLDNDDSRKIVENIEFVWENEDDFKDATTDYAKAKMYRATAIKVTLSDDDEGNGTGDDLNDNDEIDKFKIKTKIYVPVGQQEKKSIEIVGEEKYGIKDFKSATAVNVIDPFDVAFDKTTFKVGLQDQKAGKIVINETNKEMFQKGDLQFDIADGSKIFAGIAIEDKGDLSVTGDLKKADLQDANTNRSKKVNFKRQSKAASTLTVENMLVTVDRTVPEGKYDLKLSGTAIDKYDGNYTVADYVVIGTQNTDDLENSNGLAKGTATFVIGESKYVLNAIEYAMDAPSYIQDPGYTMVSIRYVANAFGIDNQDILFDKTKGTVTIFAGSRTVQLTKNSNVAIVNGASVTMGTKVVIKDGRTYAPAGEVARLLGIGTAWDSATKTATFTN